MSNENQITDKVGMIIHPVDDLEAAIKFYSEGLGLEETFRDGDRFCTFVINGVTIALAAKEERVTSSVAISYKVQNLSETITRLEDSGAELCKGPEEGPHEIRAVMNDPAGNSFIVYSPK